MSTILVDNLTGKTSAGDITVTSEGGAATQSLQQGLAKAWAFIDQKTDNAVDNSFGVTSFSDNGEGNGNINIINAMTSLIQVSQLTSYRSGTTDISGNGGASMTSTTAVLIITKTSAGAADDTEYGMTLHGDLA